MNCSECGISAPKLSRTKCHNCYMRWWKAQKKAGVPVCRPSMQERFDASCSPQADGCIHWTGYIDRQGYGKFSVSGRMQLAHRVSYELATGAAPEGPALDHTCHNRDLSCQGGPTCLHRRCVNPAHLEPVTRLENLRRSPLVAYGNKPKETCPRGHALDEANTYHHPSGTRKCRECIRDQRKKQMEGERPRAVRDSCRNGHEMTEENTYWHGPYPHCRACRSASKAARRLRVQKKRQ